MTKLEIALSYLNKGLSVIPLYSPKMLKTRPPKRFREELGKEMQKNKQSENPLPENDVIQKVLTNWCKTPCIFGWKEYQEKLPSKENVTSWFTQYPTANIAIITGAVSNLVVIDLDSEEAGEYVHEIGGLPESTVMADTGRGRHVYFSHPGFHVSNQTNTNIHIDVRGDGGYVVAPPSLHGSGRQYEWVDGSSIFDIDRAPCTTWVIDFIKNSAKNDSKPVKVKDKKQTEPQPEKPATIQPKAQETNRDEYLDLLKNGCSQGSRNHSATKLMGHLLKTGLKEPEVWEIAQSWNRDKVTPPLNPDELKKTFDSVKAMEKKNQPASVIIDSFLDDENKTVNEYQQNYVRIPFANNNLINLEKHMNGGFAGGRFYLFGGIPAAGKTVLLNNIADNICLNGYPVLFFSYDDGKEELRYRTFSRFAGKSIEEFNLRSLKSINNIYQLSTIRQILSLKYVVQQMIPVEKWLDLITQIKQKHGRPPVIIIDYLRKLRTTKNISEERLRVDDIISKLTDIAKAHNTPVIAISELARDSYKAGQQLTMASFKESGNIEYEASWLGILAAVEIGKDGEFVVKKDWERIIKQDGNIDLIIFKAKRGTGSTGKVHLKVDRKMMTVEARIDEKPAASTMFKNPVKTKY